MNGYLGGVQGEGARADVCVECGALLPPYDQAAKALHVAWHDALDLAINVRHRDPDSS